MNIKKCSTPHKLIEYIRSLGDRKQLEICNLYDSFVVSSDPNWQNIIAFTQFHNKFQDMDPENDLDSLGQMPSLINLLESELTNIFNSDNKVFIETEKKILGHLIDE